MAFLVPTWKAMYNPGQKSLGQYCNIHISLSFLGSLFKQCTLLEIFLQFSLPSPYTKVKLRKIVDTRVQHCLWGEGRGWTCMNWKTTPETQKCPKTIVHDCISSMVWTRVQYVTLHLRDWHSVAKLHYRNMPKSALSCEDWSPNWYGFCVGTKAIWHSANKALIIHF